MSGRTPLYAAGLAAGVAFVVAHEWRLVERAGLAGPMIEARGGVRLTFAIGPAGREALDALPGSARKRLEAHGVHVDAQVRGDRLIVDAAGAAPDAGERLAELMRADDDLRFQAVAHDQPFMHELAARARAEGGEVREQSDAWTAEEVGARRTEPYLDAPSREALAAFVAGDARAQAATEAAGLVIAYERMDTAWQQTEDRGAPPRWRTHVLERAPILAAGQVADARVELDQYSSQPVVMLELDREGGRRFGDFTAAHVGDKLAIVVNGDVVSAPVIQTAIRGGRAQITMGAGDPAQVRRDAENLAAALRGGPLPAPLELVGVERVDARGSAGTRRLAGSVGLALLAGALAFGAARAARRLRLDGPAAPTAPMAQLASGSPPWLRAAVTLAALPLLHYLPRVPLAGLDAAVRHDLFGNAGHTLSPFAMGLQPALSAYVLVELCALAVPRWRGLRHAGPAGRRKLELAVAALAVALAALQAWGIVYWLESLPVPLVTHPGRGFEAVTMLTLMGGTLVLVIVAGLISRHGLAGGFPVLLASSWLLGAAAQARTLHKLEQLTPAGIAALAVVAIAVAAATAKLLRVVVRLPRGPGVRLPTCGVVPLVDAAALLALLATLSTLGVLVPPKLIDWLTPHGTAHQLARVALALALGVGWSVLFTRPRPPHLFATATAVSLAWIAGLAGSDAVLRRLALAPIDAVGLVVTVAVAVDVVEEWRARRRHGDLVAIWPLHRVQHVDPAVLALAEAGVPAHARGARYRALLHFFAPFAPVVLLAPRAQAAQAAQVVAKAEAPLP